MRHFFAIICVLVLAPAVACADGTLYVYPETGIYTIGELFDIKVYADSGGQKINAAEAELTFNPDALEVQKVVTNDSILESWPTIPTFSNQKGVVRFSGWTKIPYEGAAGLLVTIRFKALRNMTSNAYLAAGAILAADGKGSNIITSMKSGLYSVGPSHAEASVDDDPRANPIDSSNTIGTATDTEKLLQTDSPDTPTFEKQSLSMDAGERIVVNGSASPNAKVLLFISKGGGEEKYSAVTSDSDGTFVFVSDQNAAEGVYRLRAATQNVEGQISPSARITVTVRSHGITAAVGETTDLISSLLPLLTLLVLGGLGAGYLYHLHAIERMKHKRIHR